MLKRCLCILLHVVLVNNSNLYSTELYSSIEHLSNWKNSNNFISKQKYFPYIQYLYYNNQMNSYLFNYLFPTYPELSKIPEIVKYCLRKHAEYEQLQRPYAASSPSEIATARAVGNVPTPTSAGIVIIIVTQASNKI